jgi:hypothetical protein
MHVGFDDSKWPSLIECKLPAFSKEDRRAYQISRVQELGGRALGVKEHVDRLWIRKAFMVGGP